MCVCVCLCVHMHYEDFHIILAFLTESGCVDKPNRGKTEGLGNQPRSIPLGQHTRLQSHTRPELIHNRNNLYVEHQELITECIQFP